MATGSGWIREPCSAQLVYTAPGQVNLLGEEHHESGELSPLVFFLVQVYI